MLMDIKLKFFIKMEMLKTHIKKNHSIQGVSKKPSLVDMLDVMDVMAQWKVVGV